MVDAENCFEPEKRTTSMTPSYDLSKFISAQQRDYPKALREIQSGRKESHWMWYIFPQLRGLGYSSTSQYYGISGLDEARAFLQNDYLGRNLKEICGVLLTIDSNSATEVFGVPDDKKLQSSMTLFSCACEGNSVFSDVLEKFFHGIPDYKTLQKLGL
jgi:uncharacterized protein (DUF1810 family)